MLTHHISSWYDIIKSLIIPISHHIASLWYYITLSSHNITLPRPLIISYMFSQTLSILLPVSSSWSLLPYNYFISLSIYLVSTNGSLKHLHSFFLDYISSLFVFICPSLFLSFLPSFFSVASPSSKQFRSWTGRMALFTAPPDVAPGTHRCFHQEFLIHSLSHSISHPLSLYLPFYMSVYLSISPPLIFSFTLYVSEIKR